jgi:DnaJ family protein B protein 12
MDGNKDEGLRCMRIGKSALESGDKVRALKFLKMAKRIYPNPQVDAFLRELAEGEEPAAAKKSDSEPDFKYQAGTGNGAQNGEHGRANGVPRSRSSKYSAEAEANGNEPERSRDGIPRSRSAASVPDATPEQIEIVRRIRKTKDYYEILGLSKTCSEEEVRKAYRKLSLKVHPDKNNAPGAEEAFKAVSKAFQVSCCTSCQFLVYCARVAPWISKISFHMQDDVRCRIRWTKGMVLNFSSVFCVVWRSKTGS